MGEQDSNILFQYYVTPCTMEQWQGVQMIQRREVCVLRSYLQQLHYLTVTIQGFGDFLLVASSIT